MPQQEAEENQQPQEEVEVFPLQDIPIEMEDELLGHLPCAMALPTNL